ncbi:MAG: methyl-accepting chemotaxis protein [Burkholderiaceae bacterium]
MSSTEARENRVEPESSAWRLGIKARLWLLMLITLLTSAALVGNTHVSIGKGSSAADRVFTAKDITADILPPPLYVVGIRLVVSEAIEGTVPIDEAIAEFQRQRREYELRLKHWSTVGANEMTENLVGHQNATAQAFMDAAYEDVLLPIRDGDPDAARGKLMKLHKLFMRHRAEVDESVGDSLAYADRQASAFLASNERMFTVNLMMLAATALALTVAFWWVIRGIWASIGAEPALLARVARTVADGDLTHGISTAEPRSVAGAFEAMRQRLRELVSVADESAREVVNAAGEIAVGNNDLSERTQELAAQVQMFRDNLQQITESIRAEANSARQADGRAREASQASRAGGAIVDQVVARMTDISTSSNKISEIISVINGIAFQTNILALNAAVEAARAGEQGRGFAVVAAEVRALAGRSSKASQEIGQLIHESSANVDGGTALVGQAGKTMHEIVLEFERVSGLISQITAAAESQTGEIESVLEGMSAIDDMNQQNAALVEEAAAAAGSLRDQAERLAKSVGVFRY